MRLITNLEDYTSLGDTAHLTIGNFDGMHRGHTALLQLLKEFPGERIALTFSNHPAMVLRGVAPLEIYPLAYKLEQLFTFVDTVILLPFTQMLSELTAEQFLQKLGQKIALRTLVLGQNATIGSDRKKAHTLTFKIDLQLCPPVVIEDQIVSSTYLRELIISGQLERAKTFLGRPYRLQGAIQRGRGLGQKLGFATINIGLNSTIAHPPRGVYLINALIDSQSYYGVANLGTAPTVKEDGVLLLEVHLFDFNQERQNKVEIEFIKFLREEKKFPSLDALKEQIKTDIQQALSLLNVLV